MAEDLTSLCPGLRRSQHGDGVFSLSLRLEGELTSKRSIMCDKRKEKKKRQDNEKLFTVAQAPFSQRWNTLNSSCILCHLGVCHAFSLDCTSTFILFSNTLYLTLGTLHK